MQVNKNSYDITSTQSNINAYNRYPFADLAEAVKNAKAKSLMPGEMAICYYFDPNTVVGISAILAIGNLRKGGNLIFENIAPQLDQFKDEICKDISETHRVVNNNIDIVNYNNKICSDVKSDLAKLEQKVEQNATSKSSWVNLNEYNLDLI